MKKVFLLLAIALGLTAGSGLLTPTPAYAADSKLTTKCDAGSAGNVCLKSLPRPAADGKAVQNILSIIIGIVAAISLLFIAIGGLRYVLSQGDPQAISRAKSTIVFALVGLIICILAQAIVVLVVKAVTK